MRMLPLLLVLAAAALPYVQSFDGPFIFDDLTVIADNPHLSSLWPITDAMQAPNRSTAAGRPLVSLSLAVNYQISGLNEWSYHALNLVFHVACAVMLWVVLVRVMNLPTMPEWIRARGRLFAWAITMLWAAHPLHTETVVYVIQRTELMSGFFALLAFWALLYDEPAGERLWPRALVLLSVVFGILCKETVAVVPILLLMFDRAFLSGSWWGAIKARSWLWPALAATWILAGWLTFDGHRGGLGGSAIESWRYLLTQGWAIIWYLRLVLVPYPLAITYDLSLYEGFVQSLPWSVLVGLMCLASIYALFRYPKVGFAAFGFFVLLAPSSSVIPILTETIAERRMYLPLIFVIGLVILAIGYLLQSRAWQSGTLTGALGAIAICGSMAFGLTSYFRTFDYDNELAVWEQNARVEPMAVMAQNNLAATYIRYQRVDDALRVLTKIERHWPKHAKLPLQLGHLAMAQGNYKQAAEYFRQASIRLPENDEPLAYGGYCYGLIGDDEAAKEMFDKAFAVKPDSVKAGNLFAVLLDRKNQRQQAIAIIRETLRANPDYSPAWCNLGVFLQKAGQTAEARTAFDRALALSPSAFDVLESFGNFEAQQGNWAKAELLFRKAVEINPEKIHTWLSLAITLRNQEKYTEADDIFRSLLRTEFRNPKVHNSYGILLAEQKRYEEAANHFRTALELDPDNKDAARNLAAARRLRDANPDGNSGDGGAAPDSPGGSSTDPPVDQPSGP